MMNNDPMPRLSNDLELHNVRMLNNKATKSGGGAFISSDVDFFDSKVEDNDAKNGGGVYVANQVDPYPVGCIYTTVSSVSPATTLHGTWEQYSQGRMLAGINTADTDFNTVGKVGGEKTVTLTEAQLPSHVHMQQGYYGVSGSGKQTEARYRISSDPQEYGANCMSTGGGGAHTNLSPYITVYYWRRTS